MKILAVLLFISSGYKAQSESPLIFSEIMFRSSASNSEFIEIYNTSSTPIDLAGFKVSYHTSLPDDLVEHNNGTILQANQFAVILEGDYDFASGIYAELIPSEALILKLSNNAFGSSGMANTSDRTIRLISNSDDTVDVYTYSANNEAGISDEKVELIKNNDAANWENSINNNGTPGNENSVTPKDFDIALTNISLAVPFAFEGNPIPIEVKIKNMGVQNVPSFLVSLYEDINEDSLIVQDELIESYQVPSLNYGDTITINFKIANPANKVYKLIVNADLPNDEVPTNNIAFFEVDVIPKPNAPNDISINEIMYNPNSGQPEWIELINNTPGDINIKNWSVSDNSTKVKITDQNLLVPKLGYLVISDDDNIVDFFEIDSPLITISLPSLNNSGDDIILIDSLSRTIDSVQYKPSWGGTGGKSLERIAPIINSNDSTNWASSKISAGATPGSENSVFPKLFNLAIKNLTISSDTPIVGENIFVLANVINTGSETYSSFRVDFYIDNNNDSTAQANELMYTESKTNLAADDSTLISYSLQNVEFRSYTIISQINSSLDQYEEDDSAIITFSVNEKPSEFNDLVINEIMYKPNSDEPEWIELYNNSMADWNLKNWRFADRSTFTLISEEDFFIQPNEFIVLSDDESLNDFYNITAKILVINLPSLNNSDDELKIIDNTGNNIDSVDYRSTWGGSYDGRSLERRLSSGASNDSTNWGSADLSVKATPGSINSIVPKEFDISVSKSEIIDEHIVVGNFITVKTMLSNVGLNDFPAFDFEVALISQTGYEIIHSEMIAPIEFGDSTIISFKSDRFRKGENTWLIEINSALDQNENNNQLVLEFQAFEIIEIPGDIIVNEIMHSPLTEESEWIEIYNKSNKAINLNGFQLADNSDTSVIMDSDLNLDSKEFFVIADDSSFIDIYSTVHNYIISPFPALNNSGDDVSLMNRINQVIDSVYYLNTWGGNNGRSLERINYEASSIDSANWTTAYLPSGGTPGTINSAAVKQNDVAVIDIVFDPQHPRINESVNVYGTFRNEGLKDIVCTALLYVDYDLDSLTNIVAASIDTVNLKSGETKTVQFGYLFEKITQEIGYLVSAQLEADQNPSNNNYYKTISPGYQAASLVINEIHYSPSDGEPEWFELVNNSADQINLKNWFSRDVLANPQTVTIVDSNLIIESNQFLVVTRDSSIFDYHLYIPSKVISSNFAILNNSEDGLVITDATGTTIDSVYFSTAITGGNGFSYERIALNSASDDLKNWGSSIDIEKSTPGRINSLTHKSFDLAITGIIYSPQFPILNNEVTPGIKVKNMGKQRANNFSVQFSLNQNNSTYSLSNTSGFTLNSNDSLIIYSQNSFELKDSIKTIAEIIFVQDEETSNNYMEDELVPGYNPKSIIITEFMSQPVSGESEWIEFLNISTELINISNWSVSDVLASPTKKVITMNNELIAPNEFFVVTSDSTKFPYYTASKLFEVNFGTLGNSEDGIILYDFRDAIIDSLFYDRTWNILMGQSTEKLYLTNISNTSSNWIPTLDIHGGTPGFINSINSISEYSRSSLVFNEIMFDPASHNCEFIEFINLSDSLINIGGWQLEDQAGNHIALSRTNKTIEPGSMILLAADTSIFDNYVFDSLEKIFIADKNDLGLSNSGEILILKDTRGNVIDSVKYNYKWHNSNFLEWKNLSLERINPSLNSNDPMNWSSSVDPNGATPLESNSILTDLIANYTDLDVDPNPFSPDNDGYEDFTIINYKLKNEPAQIRIKVFDDKGRKVRTLINNRPSSSSGSIIFDGLDDNSNPLRIGMYIVFLEAMGINSSVVETKKKVIVIARKL